MFLVFSLSVMGIAVAAATVATTNKDDVIILFLMGFLICEYTLSLRNKHLLTHIFFYVILFHVLMLLYRLLSCVLA